jgi:hypothetical protein
VTGVASGFPVGFTAGRLPGAGVIWNGIPFETLVIPAQAGIQSVGGAFPMAGGLDFRFRGNDCTWNPRVSQMTAVPLPGRPCMKPPMLLEYW